MLGRQNSGFSWPAQILLLRVFAHGKRLDLFCNSGCPLNLQNFFKWVRVITETTVKFSFVHTLHLSCLCPTLWPEWCLSATLINMMSLSLHESYLHHFKGLSSVSDKNQKKAVHLWTRNICLVTPYHSTFGVRNFPNSSFRWLENDNKQGNYFCNF